MTVDLGALPGPWAAVAYVVTQLARTLVWLVVTPSQNVAQLGWWWVPFYWLLVYACALLGGWGGARIRTVRRGADFFEFDPNRRGGAWAGAPVKLIRLQVAGEAWAAGAGVVVGYGGVALLLTIGLLWRWLPLLAVGGLWWWWRARTRPAWWEGSTS